MYKRIINRLLKRLELKRVATENKVVFLTFDDGPEKGVTEFVIKELDKYNYKATFFCRGDTAEKNPDLLSLIKEKGHRIGNHTYSHMHSYSVTSSDYLADVEKANVILHAQLFRPPHGSLKLGAFLRIFHKYRIVYWSLNSEDSAQESFNLVHADNKLKQKTKPGDIILFHFCHKHEKETMQLLPLYLSWLSKQGYQSKAIEEL